MFIWLSVKLEITLKLRIILKLLTVSLMNKEPVA